MFQRSIFLFLDINKIADVTEHSANRILSPIVMMTSWWIMFLSFYFSYHGLKLLFTICYLFSWLVWVLWSLLLFWIIGLRFAIGWLFVSTVLFHSGIIIIPSSESIISNLALCIDVWTTNVCEIQTNEFV